MSDFPFTCPYCQATHLIPENVWHYSCSQCGQGLNLESQFAFLRGLDAFAEGQEIMFSISPKRRKNTNYNAQDRLAMDLFLEAYSSIQLAFRSELAEIQRSVGVEMMANMAAEFIRRSMISPMEQSYWATLLVLQNVQTEYDQLKLDLSAPGGALAWIKRLRWRTRQNQLRAALVELERRLAAIERQIDFVEVPRARKTNWTA